MTTFSQPELPLVLSVDQLISMPAQPTTVIVDLPTRIDRYRDGHIPGARFLDYRQLFSGRAPCHADAPDDDALAILLSSLGITPTTHVIAYDDEGGGWASRLLWTLALIGHRHYSLLDGGLHAWQAAAQPLEQLQPPPVTSSAYPIGPRNLQVSTTAASLLSSLDDIVIWDTRSADEYHGLMGQAQRLGHIPGAVHLDWCQLFDQANAFRLHSCEALQTLLADHGLTPDRKIVAHCQSHHRSSLAWLVGQYLDYPALSAYPGAWQEWGNRQDTPIVR